MSIRELFDHQVFNAALDSPFELFGFHGSALVNFPGLTSGGSAKLLLDGWCSVSAALETGAKIKRNAALRVIDEKEICDALEKTQDD